MTIARLYSLFLVGVSCVLLSSCSGSREPTPTGPPGPSVQVVETSGDRAKLLQAQPSVAFATGGSSSGLVIQVNATTQYQQMDGVGGSLTDSSAWLIWNTLSTAQQTTLM